MQLRARPAVVLCGTPMSASYADELAVARRAAEEAGRFALGHFKTRLTVEVKADGSPVTIADRGAEECLRRVLGAAFPGDGFLGEELGETSGTSGRRWIIDPIDGTQSFIRGVPLWGVLVALEDRGECVVGVMALPALGETLWAVRGGGAFVNGAPARVSDVALADATILTSDASPRHFGEKHAGFTTPARAERAPSRLGRLLRLRARRDRPRRGHAGSSDELVGRGGRPTDHRGGGRYVLRVGRHGDDLRRLRAGDAEDAPRAGPRRAPRRLLKKGHLRRCSVVRLCGIAPLCLRARFLAPSS